MAGTTKGMLALALAALCAGARGADIDALLAKMTLEEKLGQLCQVHSAKSDVPASVDASGAAFDEKFVARVRAGGIGSLIGACGMEKFNRIQKVAVEGSRLGIPLMLGHDMIHGCIVGLPIPLASSCSFDEELWRRIAESTARNARAKGCNWAFAPMLDIARDARWGRIAEGAGQDPLVCSRYAAAQVRGYQGENPADGLHVAACLKHFAGYGAAIAGRDYNNIELGESTFRDVYLPPFAAAVRAGALTVMPAFHGFNGVPCSVNRWLLTDVLRGDLGFDGFTVSDWAAVEQSAQCGHAVADGDAEVTALAIHAGMDMEMVSESFQRGLKAAVEKGLLPMADVDKAVRRVLAVKDRLGLFERPYFDVDAVLASLRPEEDLALAREAARKSVVLLKNEGGVLPLKPGRKVAVVGDLAADGDDMQGCWSSYWEVCRNASLVDGLRADGVDVAYSRCYTITGAVDAAAIAAAAAKADVVVAAFGEYRSMSGENCSRADISLPGRQLEALAALKASGKPFVAVLFGGRPLAVPELAAAADAVVEGWSLGASAGWGIADVLTGAAEPYGRLTVDFPTLTGECPKYYNRPTTGRPHQPGRRWTTLYLDAPDRSLWPFGFGLTYTTFAYSDAKAEAADGKVRLSCTVKNTGARKGSELVQAYARALNAGRTQPRRSLKGWRRVELAPGESKRVEFVLTPAELGWHEESRFVEGRGRFEAWLAPDSDSGEKLAFSL